MIIVVSVQALLRVKKLAVISPPMITKARGFAVSEPTPVEIAAGIKPSMEAVMTTGRKDSAFPPEHKTLRKG